MEPLKVESWGFKFIYFTTSINMFTLKTLETTQQNFRNSHYVSFACTPPLKAAPQLNTIAGPAFRSKGKAILEQCSVTGNKFILCALLIRL